jgi:N-acetylglucosaminyldiphosphoundecaprenol N-acetyl-beta-D-mannosaminyltransferase
MPAKRVTVGGVSFDALTEDRVVDHVRAALGRGQGGRILTPNVDVLRQIARNGDAQAALRDSTLVVADGMPVIWASRLAGTPLPQRVSGADLIWSLSRGLGRDGRSIFVLGGRPVGQAVGGQPAEIESEELPPNMGTANRIARAQRLNELPTGRHSVNPYREMTVNHRNAGPLHRADEPRGPRNETVPFQRTSTDGAGRAAAALLKRCPGLSIAGAISPPFGFDTDPDAYALLMDEIIAARPDLVLVGIGFPRQERLIGALRGDLPAAWFLGCGQAINFAAGEQRRAPQWMQRTGVEWLHRLALEPRRLAERYLRQDLPFAASLLTRTVIARYQRPGRHGR